MIPNTVQKKEEEDRNNELCRNAKVDVMVTTKDKTTYAFKGSKYWRLTDDGVAKGYPRSISRDWDGLPSNLDAAFTWTNGRTYFFRGSKYWRFTNQEMDKGYPKPINKGFDGIPHFVDAAFVWSGNGKIYFFKVSYNKSGMFGTKCIDCKCQNNGGISIYHFISRGTSIIGSTQKQDHL